MDEGRWGSAQENAAYPAAAGDRNTAGGREAAVKIRDATLADLPAIVEIYDFTLPSRKVTADPEPVSVESRHAWFLQHDPRDYRLWVAEMEGEIVGWFGFEPFRRKPAYWATAEISVYVSEKRRRKGIEKRLLAIRCGPSLVLKTLTGGIFARNEPSVGCSRNSARALGALPEGRETRRRRTGSGSPRPPARQRHSSRRLVTTKGTKRV